MPLDEYRAANRDHWDECVPHHTAAGSMYDVARFIAGGSTLTSIEIQELGDVSAKSLLHLQCHFGLDTLSWARLGAAITGIDFSEPATATARNLSQDAGVPGRFVVCELYDTPSVSVEQFDIVYTGIGALCWIPDIRGWARVVSDALSPGGTFYILEFHPVLWSLDNERTDAELVIRHPYFEAAEPTRWDDVTTYANPEARLRNTTAYEWNHGIGEIVTALLDAGLAIKLLNEHRVCYPQMAPSLVRGDDGWWRLPEGRDRLPLMYSIRARKTGPA